MSPGQQEPEWQAGGPGTREAARRVAHRVTLVGPAAGFDVPKGERIHAAARRAGVWLPFECGWGSCGLCKATLVEGEVELLFPASPALDARDERRRRILLCQSTPLTDLVLRPQRAAAEPPAERPTADYQGRLAAVEPLAPGIARFRFDLLDGAGRPVVARYRPGQYAVLELAAGLRRCYSMAGAPGGNQVEFIAKRSPGGAGSARLFELRPGTPVHLELPYGDLWLRDGPGPTLLIAGGTGISAVLAMLAGLATAPAPPRTRGTAGTMSGPVHVFYGATSRADLVCWDELTRLVGRIPAAHLHGALVLPDAAWTGARGLVTDALRAHLDRHNEQHQRHRPGSAADHEPARDHEATRGNEPARDHETTGDHEAAGDAYLAGPPAMVRAVRDLLGLRGWSADRIHVDSFG